MKNRVWIYMSDKELTDEQLGVLQQASAEFLRGWNAHGQALSASFEILHKRFLIIKANEEQFTASGCSIDKQVQFVKSMEQVFTVNFFNRLLVAVKKEEAVEVIHSSKVADLLKNGTLSAETLVYNCAIATEEELSANFLIPLKKSWLNKFIPAKV